MTKAFHGQIEDTLDALIIFEGCRQGVLPKINRRLLAAERGEFKSRALAISSTPSSAFTRGVPATGIAASDYALTQKNTNDVEQDNSDDKELLNPSLITPGSVFVFDEDESGICRWTDGRLWSPSRISGNFLVYRELFRKLNNEKCWTADDKARMKDGSGIKDEALKAKVEKENLVVMGCMKGTFVWKKGGLIKKTMCVKGVDLVSPEKLIERTEQTSRGEGGGSSGGQAKKRGTSVRSHVSMTGTQHMVCYENAGAMDDFHRPRDYLELRDLRLSKTFIACQHFRNPVRISPLAPGEQPSDPYDEYISNTRVVESKPSAKKHKSISKAQLSTKVETAAQRSRTLRDVKKTHKGVQNRVTKQSQAQVQVEHSRTDKSSGASGDGQESLIGRSSHESYPGRSEKNSKISATPRPLLNHPYPTRGQDRQQQEAFERMMRNQEQQRKREERQKHQQQQRQQLPQMQNRQETTESSPPRSENNVIPTSSPGGDAIKSRGQILYQLFNSAPTETAKELDTGGKGYIQAQLTGNSHQLVPDWVPSEQVAGDFALRGLISDHGGWRWHSTLSQSGDISSSDHPAPFDGKAPWQDCMYQAHHYEPLENNQDYLQKDHPAMNPSEHNESSNRIIEWPFTHGPSEETIACESLEHEVQRGQRLQDSGVDQILAPTSFSRVTNREHDEAGDVYKTRIKSESASPQPWPIIDAVSSSSWSSSSLSSRESLSSSLSLSLSSAAAAKHTMSNSTATAHPNGPSAVEPSSILTKSQSTHSGDVLHSGNAPWKSMTFLRVSEQQRSHIEQDQGVSGHPTERSTWNPSSRLGNGYGYYSQAKSAAEFSGQANAGVPGTTLFTQGVPQGASHILNMPQTSFYHTGARGVDGSAYQPPGFPSGAHHQQSLGGLSNEQATTEASFPSPCFSNRRGSSGWSFTCTPAHREALEVSQSSDVQQYQRHNVIIGGCHVERSPRPSEQLGAGDPQEATPHDHPQTQQQQLQALGLEMKRAVADILTENGDLEVALVAATRTGKGEDDISPAKRRKTFGSFGQQERIVRSGEYHAIDGWAPPVRLAGSWYNEASFSGSYVGTPQASNVTTSQPILQYATSAPIADPVTTSRSSILFQEPTWQSPNSKQRFMSPSSFLFPSTCGQQGTRQSTLHPITVAAPFDPLQQLSLGPETSSSGVSATPGFENHAQHCYSRASQSFVPTYNVASSSLDPRPLYFNNSRTAASLQRRQQREQQQDRDFASVESLFMNTQADMIGRENQQCASSTSSDSAQAHFTCPGVVLDPSLSSSDATDMMRMSLMTLITPDPQDASSNFGARPSISAIPVLNNAAIFEDHDASVKHPPEYSPLARTSSIASVGLGKDEYLLHAQLSNNSTLSRIDELSYYTGNHKSGALLSTSSLVRATTTAEEGSGKLPSSDDLPSHVYRHYQQDLHGRSRDRQGQYRDRDREDFSSPDLLLSCLSEQRSWQMTVRDEPSSSDTHQFSDPPEQHVFEEDSVHVESHGEGEDGIAASDEVGSQGGPQDQLLDEPQDEPQEEKSIEAERIMAEVVAQHVGHDVVCGLGQVVEDDGECLDV